MNDLKKATNKYGATQGYFTSILAMLLTTGIFYVLLWQLTGIDLEKIDIYIYAVLAWAPIVIISQILKFYFFDKVTKWHFWLGWEIELALAIIFIICLGFTGDAGA